MQLTKRMKRISVMAGVGAAGGLMAFGSIAFACTTLISMRVNPAALVAGATGTITGASFEPTTVGAAQGDTAPGGADAYSGVTVNILDSQGNFVESLGTVNTDPTGAFAMTFTVPDVQPGQYLAYATQQDLTSGKTTSFTPVRAVFAVPAPAATTAPAPTPAPAQATPTPAPATSPTPATNTSPAPATNTSPAPATNTSPAPSSAPAASTAPASSPAASTAPAQTNTAPAATPSAAPQSTPAAQSTTPASSATQAPAANPSPTVQHPASSGASQSAVAPPHPAGASIWWLVGLSVGGAGVLGMAGATWARSSSRRRALAQAKK
ncbi:MAG: hypothetical protein ACRDYC_04160 [Acidimicrobiales bacterium]